MDHLDDISHTKLREMLARTERKKPALRLVVAIAYKEGVTQTELANWLDVERKTIYNWLYRFTAEDIEAAIHDEDRPGRPRKLSSDELESVEVLLTKSPVALGYEDTEWKPTLLQDVLKDRFNIVTIRNNCSLQEGSTVPKLRRLSV